MTGLDKNKQGIATASSFPKQDEHKPRKNVFGEF